VNSRVCALTEGIKLLFLIITSRRHWVVDRVLGSSDEPLVNQARPGAVDGSGWVGVIGPPLGSAGEAIRLGEVMILSHCD
jgi:hypothetical protein